MAYILSNSERLYAAMESTYGSIPAITAANRIPVVKLDVRQQLEIPTRRDKTGSRTFSGTPSGVRRVTNFSLQSYLTSWPQSSGAPAFGALFQSALGAAAVEFTGGTVAAATDGANISFTSPHGLVVGQAVSSGSELRFVAAIASPTSVVLNAPFSTTPAQGSAFQAAATYMPASNLPSLSIFDYWSPSTAVQRVVHGAVVNEMQIRVNGDYHEFQFSGLAQDLVDSSSYSGNASSLQSFPSEPAITSFAYSIVPGNLGQAWLGTSASQFFTVTGASIGLKNNLESRAREFGSSLPLAMSPGRRDVAVSLELYTEDDAATEGLYQAARQESPISVMFQLGGASGQMMAVYLQSVIPSVPQFIDSQNRLQWSFHPSRAQGTVDNEIQVAFG